MADSRRHPLPVEYDRENVGEYVYQFFGWKAMCWGLCMQNLSRNVVSAALDQSLVFFFFISVAKWWISREAGDDFKQTHEAVLLPFISCLLVCFNLHIMNEFKILISCISAKNPRLHEKVPSYSVSVL